MAEEGEKGRVPYQRRVEGASQKNRPRSTPFRTIRKLTADNMRNQRNYNKDIHSAPPPTSPWPPSPTLSVNTCLSHHRTVVRLGGRPERHGKAKDEVA